MMTWWGWTPGCGSVFTQSAPEKRVRAKVGGQTQPRERGCGPWRGRREISSWREADLGGRSCFLFFACRSKSGALDLCRNWAKLPHNRAGVNSRHPGSGLERRALMRLEVGGGCASTRRESSDSCSPRSATAWTGVCWQFKLGGAAASDSKAVGVVVPSKSWNRKRKTTGHQWNQKALSPSRWLLNPSRFGHFPQQAPVLSWRSALLTPAACRAEWVVQRKAGLWS